MARQATHETAHVQTLKIHQLENRVAQLEDSTTALSRVFPRLEVLMERLEARRLRDPSSSSLSHSTRHPGVSAKATCSSLSHPCPNAPRTVSFRKSNAQAEELLAAASCGDAHAARRLLDAGADVHLRDRGARTALHRAADKAHADLVSLLVERGADVHAKDIRESTALHYAACSDRSGRCVELLVAAGADVHSRDHCGATPLHKAVQSDNEAAVRVLLAAGADKAVEENRGRTPFDYAKDETLRRILRT